MFWNLNEKLRNNEIMINVVYIETLILQDEEPVYGKHWTKGEDYYRMDGSTSAEKRKDMASKFNDPENYK